MWKNTAQPDRPQMTLRMHIACWIPKATNTLRICNTYHFSMQQCLYDCSILHHMYIASPVKKLSSFTSQSQVMHEVAKRNIQGQQNKFRQGYDDMVHTAMLMKYENKRCRNKIWHQYNGKAYKNSI